MYRRTSCIPYLRCEETYFSGPTLLSLNQFRKTQSFFEHVNGYSSVKPHSLLQYKNNGRARNLVFTDNTAHCLVKMMTF